MIKEIRLEYVEKPVQIKPPWNQLLCSVQTGVIFIQVKLTKQKKPTLGLYYLKFCLIKDSGLFRVGFRMLSLQLLQIYFDFLFKSLIGMKRGIKQQYKQYEDKIYDNLDLRGVCTS